MPSSAHHISFLRENTVVQALWCHPFHRELDTVLAVSTLSEIVLGVDVLRQTKVGNLDDKVKIDPVQITVVNYFRDTGFRIAHMQFLAARSL